MKWMDVRLVLSFRRDATNGRFVRISRVEVSVVSSFMMMLMSFPVELVAAVNFMNYEFTRHFTVQCSFLPSFPF